MEIWRTTKIWWLLSSQAFYFALSTNFLKKKKKTLNIQLTVYTFLNLKIISYLRISCSMFWSFFTFSTFSSRTITSLYLTNFVCFLKNSIFSLLFSAPWQVLSFCAIYHILLLKWGLRDWCMGINISHY